MSDGTAVTGRRRDRIDPDRLAELEHERAFLLRSLDDLEREYAAGDLDEVDYRELRDGYTARAAATLRAIDEGRSALPPAPPPNWRRRGVAAVVVVVLIGVVWWALSASSAQRLPGQEITGLDPRGERTVLLAQARSLQASDPAGAVALYDLVLEDTPEHAEALAYRGWNNAIAAVNAPEGSVDLAAELRDSLDSLFRSAEVDPDYPDPHCFLGIIYANFLGQDELAVPELEFCLAENPPADVRGLVEGLLSRVDDQE